MSVDLKFSKKWAPSLVYLRILQKKLSHFLWFIEVGRTHILSRISLACHLLDKYTLCGQSKVVSETVIYTNAIHGNLNTKLLYCKGFRLANKQQSGHKLVMSLV